MTASEEEEPEASVIPTSEPSFVAEAEEPPFPAWLRPLDRFFPAVVTLFTTVTLYWVMSRAAMTAGGSPFSLVFGLYVVLGAITVFRLKARGELSHLRPRGGDLTFGALVTLLLYGSAYVFHVLVTAPGQPRYEWVLQIYLRLGNPFAEDRHWVALFAAAIGALEELTWRGGVTAALEERLGLGMGNLLGVALYASAHVATMWALSGAQGLNPVLLLASAGCGAVWSYLRFRSDQQLAPVLFSHALFTWSVVEFPLFGRG